MRAIDRELILDLMFGIVGIVVGIGLGYFAWLIAAVGDP
jgi:hypothetical protein